MLWCDCKCSDVNVNSQVLTVNALVLTVNALFLTVKCSGAECKYMYICLTVNALV